MNEPSPEQIEKVLSWFLNDPAWIAWPFLKMQVGTLVAALRSSQAKLAAAKKVVAAAWLIHVAHSLENSVCLCALCLAFDALDDYEEFLNGRTKLEKP